MLHNSCLITFIRVLIDISNVLHCQSKHGVSGADQTDGRHSIPASLSVHVDVNSSSNISVLHVELRGSDHNVLPSGPKWCTDYFMVHVCWMDVSESEIESVSHPSPSRSTTATSYPKEEASPGPWKVCSTKSLDEVSLSFFNRTTAPLWLALGAPATTVRSKLLVILCPESSENPGQRHHGHMTMTLNGGVNKSGLFIQR